MPVDALRAMGADVEAALEDVNVPTPRQAEVLRLLERGRSTTQIAEELQLSRETVRNHVRHLLHALGASSRLEAVAVARGDRLNAAGT